ncbi:exo-alpha-sialidase [Trypanosoma cruzi]|nr:exo-alpha-sialidase [Trypanosoma cruzi]
MFGHCLPTGHSAPASCPSNVNPLGTFFAAPLTTAFTPRYSSSHLSPRSVSAKWPTSPVVGIGTEQSPLDSAAPEAIELHCRDNAMSFAAQLDSACHIFCSSDVRSKKKAPESLPTPASYKQYSLLFAYNRELEVAPYPVGSRPTW